MAFLVFAVFGGFMVSPRRFWWKAVAWKYRYPKANEPSDKLYVCYRLLGVVLVIVGSVGAVHNFTNARAEYRERHIGFEHRLLIAVPELATHSANVPYKPKTHNESRNAALANGNPTLTAPITPPQ